jgi:hypothetical protein
MFEKPGTCIDSVGMKAMMSAYVSITLMAVQLPKSTKMLAARLQFAAGRYPEADDTLKDDSFADTDPGKFAMLRDAWVPVAVPAFCNLLDRIIDYADQMTSRYVDHDEYSLPR